MYNVSLLLAWGVRRALVHGQVKKAGAEAEAAGAAEADGEAARADALMSRSSLL